MSGDEDFVPIVEKLKELDKSVELWAFRYSLANALKEELENRNLYYLDDILGKLSIFNTENIKEPDEYLIQKVVDPKTGRDITGEYISNKLKQLEIEAEKIIKDAVAELNAHPTKRLDIYEKTYWLIHERLGTGSIGPASAAAGPLMAEMKQKLAEALGIYDSDVIY